jgi:hypothetical protein
VVTDDVDHHEVGPAGGQAVVVQPARRREVRQEQTGVVTGSGDEIDQQLPSPRRAQVDGHRPLPLVHPGPEQALPVGRHRPPAGVEPAADRIEADHVGAELGQRHPAEWGSYECRTFDDPHATEDAVHRVCLLCFKP